MLENMTILLCTVIYQSSGVKDQEQFSGFEELPCTENQLSSNDQLTEYIIS